MAYPQGARSILFLLALLVDKIGGVTQWSLHPRKLVSLTNDGGGSGI